jgi:hypothetical protein
MRAVCRAIVISCGLAGALLAVPAAAQSDTYRVDAQGSDDVTLTLCHPQVRVEVRGDGDTDLDFTISNGSGSVLHSDADETDWTVTNIDNADSECRKYKLHVENLGDVYNEYTVEMTNIAAGSSSDGRDRQVAVHNHTGETIYYIYWSNTGDDDWREDRLGSEVLMEGQEWSVEVDDGSGACRFDFRVRTASDREIVRNDINVCEVSSVDFN